MPLAAGSFSPAVEPAERLEVVAALCPSGRYRLRIDREILNIDPVIADHLVPGCLACRKRVCLLSRGPGVAW